MPRPKKSARKAIKKRNTSAISFTNIQLAHKSFPIETDKIHKPDWMVEKDPLFLKLYTKYLLGKIPGFATRIPTEMILEGFYLPDQDFRYLRDSPPEDVIQDMMRSVQHGSRRPLHLYKNLNPYCSYRYLCPDEVALCIAYKRLKISAVPAIVFAPGNQELPFSSFESRVRPAATGQGPRITGIVSAEKRSKVASIIGPKIPENPRDVLIKLRLSLNRVVARLRLFHITDSENLHYHHMLFSALVRAEETVKAIEKLIEEDLWYQALALLRVLYELHLNFYFDWLQPQTNYRYLAAAAVWNTADISRQKRGMTEELISEGMPSKIASDAAETAWLPVTMASKVSEKAKLPQIGILYHADIYEFLSRISHQNFEVASLHANRFDDETFKAIDNNTKTTYLRFMDFIVTEFVECMDSDIGEPMSRAIRDETLSNDENGNP